MSRQLLVATFSSADALLDAARRARDLGLSIDDAYTPYPIHHLDHLIGRRPSRLPFVTLLGGVLGAAGALAMQFYMAVFDWPLNVGGKPPNSLLAFLPITFELTVLCAGLLTAGAFLVRSRLKPGARAGRIAVRATEDTFTLVLHCRPREDGCDHCEAMRLLAASGATVLKDVQS